jgi:Domain of unknown function (DUF6471)
VPVFYYNCKMNAKFWSNKAKRLLKAELVKRGITHEQLVTLLSEIGVSETKASIDSKISRGSFSAAFLIQCLIAIGCASFCPDTDTSVDASASWFNKKSTNTD